MRDLKVKHLSTEIPSELSFRIKKSIHKGAVHMKKQRNKKGILKVIGSIAAAVLVFVLVLNTSPVFADYISRLPGGATIVRLLTFVDDQAVGGEITDGQDIRRITVQRRAGHEIIQVDFSAGFDFTQINPGESPAEIAGHFTVTRNTHPNSIVVYVAGVRGFTAAQNLPDLSRLQLIGGIYRIVTFDDSAHRFVVTFNKPVTIDIIEQRNPARMIIQVREDKEAVALPVMYSLRTQSTSLGFEAGEAEENFKFLGSTRARILRDAEGMYLAEEGLYSTRTEAEARLTELRKDQPELALHIEEREAWQLPKSIQ